MSINKQTHGFCETPHEKCTMSYCDENGCMNRKRNIVGAPIEMSNSKQSSIDWQHVELIRIDYQYAINKITPREYQEQTKNALEQAKAMHKEEIENAWYNGYLHQGEMFEHENLGEEFYNETFKNES